MRYKGKFYPSELLCPEYYVWVDLESCMRDKSHMFLSLRHCSEATINCPKDPNMDIETGIEDFIKQNVQIKVKT